MAYSFLLKQARKKANLSLRKAAAIFGLSPSTLNRYEEGLISHIPPRNLLMLLRYYDVSPDEMREKWIYRNMLERLSRYEESQHHIDADFLYNRYISLDERGRRNVLRLLLYEQDVTAELRSSNNSLRLQ